MGNKVIIFTEGGKKYGLGHITRCSALYDELVKQGHEPIFVVGNDLCVVPPAKNDAHIVPSGENDSLIDMLGDKKYIIDNWYENPEKYFEDIQTKCRGELCSSNPDINNQVGPVGADASVRPTQTQQKPYAIIDSYIATFETCKRIFDACRGGYHPSNPDIDLQDNNSVGNDLCVVPMNAHIVPSNIIYIDDTNRIAYPAGIIVNPAIFGDKINYTKKPNQKYLLGKDYVILRPEFICRGGYYPSKPICRSANNPPKILIIMGGTDIKKLTAKIVQTILASKYKDFEINIPKNLNASQMFDLMTTCDIAISAAGQTVHELIACELPFVCVKVIDNQKYNVQGLLEHGIIDDYIDCEGAPEQALENIDKKLIPQIKKLDDEKNRKSILQNMGKLGLGNGAENIIKEFIR